MHYASSALHFEQKILQCLATPLWSTLLPGLLSHYKEIGEIDQFELLLLTYKIGNKKYMKKDLDKK